jgi:hypothetical protein
VATKKRKKKRSSSPQVKGSTRKTRKKATGKVPRKIAKKRPATKSRKKTRRKAAAKVLGELLVTEVNRDLVFGLPGDESIDAEEIDFEGEASEPEPPDGGPGI